MNFRVSMSLLFVSLACGCSVGDYKPASGDILFQDLASPQGQAVQLATGSDFTHCGIVLEVDGEFLVYEAVGPVRAIPLRQWIAQGVDSKMVAMRLDPFGPELTEKSLRRMREEAGSYMGKAYDAVFNWSDDLIYCSELVWKIYAEGRGLELAPLRPLGDYDLSHPAVRDKLRERYGDSIPLDEPMVAPGDLGDSEHLRTVYSNWE